MTNKKHRSNIWLLQIGKTIKSHRETNDISQEDFAKLVGISRSTLIAIEKGTAPNVGISTLYSIAEVLKINPLVLFITKEDWEKLINLTHFFQFTKFDSSVLKLKDIELEEMKKLELSIENEKRKELTKEIINIVFPFLEGDTTATILPTALIASSMAQKSPLVAVLTGAIMAQQRKII